MNFNQKQKYLRRPFYILIGRYMFKPNPSILQNKKIAETEMKTGKQIIDKIAAKT
jgi:hypothetical protein